MKLAFIIDPISQLDPGHDTSVALMESAQAMGHQVWVAQANQLMIIDGLAWAHLQQVQLKPVSLVNGLWQAERDWYQLAPEVLTCLDEMDCIWMRIDPPVNVNYLYTTYILDLVDPTQTLVINSPQGLRNSNEKVYAFQFISVMPETIVTLSKDVVEDFLKKKGTAVIKPLGGKAGEGVLFLQSGDRNFNSLIEISTKQGREPVMVQEYLPAAQDGDKRIILLDGEPIGAVNRIPTGKEFRGNMAVGGQVAAVEITEREQEICNLLGPRLRQDGLYFVGIDVIGGYLTEVNVTSPTGIREIDRLNNIDLGTKVINWIEEKIQ